MKKYSLNINKYFAAMKNIEVCNKTMYCNNFVTITGVNVITSMRKKLLLIAKFRYFYADAATSAI